MTPYLQDADFTLYVGDVRQVLAELEPGSVDCVITSPPYWGLRDYGTGEWDGGDTDCDHKNTNWDRQLLNDGANRDRTTPMRESCHRCGARRVDNQIGLEPTPDLFVQTMVDVFREVRRVLADHGTCWVNLSGSYASGDTGSNPSRRRPNVPACDTDGKAPQDSSGPDSAYRDLCDGCADALANRIAHTSLPLDESGQHASPTIRDNEPQDFELTPPDASALVAPASTTQRSSPQPPGACSHCSNCDACLAVLRSSSRDARLCARTGAYTNDSGSTSSERRNQDTGASGTAWSNFTFKQKDLVPTPWMVAMALQQDGWYLRSDIAWTKLNPMPESVTDRPTSAWEHVFLLAKRPRYWFDAEAVREPHSAASIGRAAYGFNGYGTDDKEHVRYEPGRNHVALNPAGRNVRNVWEIATQPYAGAHFATYPEELVRRCLLAGCPEWVCRVCGRPRERIVEREFVKLANRLPTRKAQQDGADMADVNSHNAMGYNNVATLGWSDCGHGDYRPGRVLDPFIGSGTTALVARNHGRRTVGVELNPGYAALCATRLRQLSLLAEATVG